MTDDHKLLKERKLDKNTTVKISKNIMSGRIFVEYKSLAPNMTLQKNFQDTYQGKLEAEEFAKKFKSNEQIRAYFGIKE